MAAVLSIGGEVVDRAETRTRLHRLTQTFDGVDVLEFTSSGGGIAPPWPLGAVCLLELEDAIRFHGRITGVQSEPGEDGWRHGFTALGIEYVANLLALTNPLTGNGMYHFNLPSTDPDAIAALSGLSVGSMLVRVLDDHAIELQARGIGEWTGSPPALSEPSRSELLALTLTPPDPVGLQGERLWTALQGLLRDHAPNHVLRIEPDGSIHCWDLTALPVEVITWGLDPIDPPMLTRELTDCHTRVVLRGEARVEAASLSLADGTLAAGWTAGEQAAWTIDDFEAPRAARSVGAVANLTSSVVTVNPDDDAEHWSVNFWGPANVRGELLLRNTALAGVEQFESRPVFSNTALAAGSGQTSEITVEFPLEGSAYQRYELIGRGSGRSHVWRRFRPADPAVAAALAKRFARLMPFRFENGVQMVRFPMGVVRWIENGATKAVALVVEIDPADGTIWFSQPVCALTSSRDALTTGGAAVTPPFDVCVYAPVRWGNLEAVAPASGYGGTAHLLHGWQETRVIDVPSWNDPGALGRLTALAQAIHASVAGLVVEGQIVHHGRAPALESLGFAVELAAIDAPGGAAVPTGLEGVALPVRSTTLEWPERGADVHRVALAVSTRRHGVSGDRFYLHGAHWDSVWLE